MERDSVITCCPARPRSSPRAAAASTQPVRQPGEVLLGLRATSCQDGFVGQHVLAELGARASASRSTISASRAAVRLLQLRAGAHEALVGELEHPALLIGQAERRRRWPRSASMRANSASFMAMSL